MKRNRRLPQVEVPKFRGLIGSSLAATLALTTALGSAHAMTLSEALGKSLTRDPNYLAAMKARDVGAEKKFQGLANILPNVSGTYTDGKRLERKVTSPEGDVTRARIDDDDRAYTITARQPLFNLAAIRSVQQGFKASSASEATFQIARQDAMVRLVNAYFEVLNAQDSLATTVAEKMAIEEQLEAAKRSFEVGTATVTDQQEAQARFDLTRAAEIRARNNLNIRRQALSILIGEPVSKDLPSYKAGAEIPAPMPLVPDEWVNRARESSYEVQRAFAEAERNRYEFSRQLFNNLPSVDLIARKTWAKDPPGAAAAGSSGEKIETEYVGISVTVPILSGGLNISQVREAAALRDEFKHRLDAARLNAEQSSREAYLNVVAGLAQISALEAAEKSSQLALESTRLGYQVGVRINIDVLNAQQQLFAAQRDLSKARTDTLLAGLRLKASVGALNPDDVDVVSGLILGQAPKKN